MRGQSRLDARTGLLQTGASMSEFERTTLHANDLSFSALTAGSGPVVLCLHGFPDHRNSWRFQLPALAAAGFRAVAPDVAWAKLAALRAGADLATQRLF